MKNNIKNYVQEALGINDSHDKISEISSKQDTIIGKIQILEDKISEITRAVAMLALVQSNLIRELGDMAERESRKKTKQVYTRKTGTDFTN